MSRLLVIDTSGLLHRAWHATRGADCFAYFTSTLDRLADSLSPSRIVLAMDEGESFRRKMYPPYKAHRGARPEWVADETLNVERDAEENGIAVVGSDGYEADDVIATIARSHDCDVVSADKDLLQVVRDGVDVLAPDARGSGFSRIDVQGVKDRWGVGPEWLKEMFALMGDSSDNIPGVRGVGEVKARELVYAFGALESIYENLPAVRPERLRALLAGSRDDAFMSRRLVTLRDNIPLEGL